MCQPRKSLPHPPVRPKARWHWGADTAFNLLRVGGRIREVGIRHTRPDKHIQRAQCLAMRDMLFGLCKLSVGQIKLDREVGPRGGYFEAGTTAQTYPDKL